MGLNNPGQPAIDTAALIQSWETELRMESLPRDIFDFSSKDAVYTVDQQVPIPDAIYMNLKNINTSSRNVTCSLLKALEEDPTEGATATAVGNEEQLRTRVARFYNNDVSHQVAGQSYGLFSIDTLAYDLYEKIGPLLSVYFKQLFGFYRRQAFIEGYSQNIYADVHTALGPALHPNMYIAGLADSAQPTFLQNGNAWENAVAQAIVDAGTGTDATSTLRYYQRLQHYATARKFIEPIYIGGKPRYIVVIPSNQATWLKDAANSGQLGNQWVNYSGLTESEQMFFPDIIGRIGMLLFVEDPLYPTLSVGGSAGAYSLTAGYFKYGRVDERDHSADARDVGMLLGKGALCEWKPEDLHFEYERENYSKIYGKGLFATVGIQRVDYDISDETSRTPTTRQNEGSIMLVFAKPPLS